MGEIRCDGCGSRFDGDSLDAASAVRWLIADAILCPCCAEAWEQAAAVTEWEKAETYGRHSIHQVTDRVSPGEPFISDAMIFARAYFEQHPTNRTGRQSCREYRGTIHPNVTVAELRLAVTG